MKRNNELELHRHAQHLFEAENPGRLWRQPSGVAPAVGQRYAEMIERQEYLARVRSEMRRQGIQMEAEVESSDA